MTRVTSNRVFLDPLAGSSRQQVDTPLQVAADACEPARQAGIWNLGSWSFSRLFTNSSRLTSDELSFKHALDNWANDNSISQAELAERQSLAQYILTQKSHSMSLSGRILITALPYELKVDGCLNLCGCINLRNLPRNLQVGKYLNLTDCSNLTELPIGLNIGEYLDLTRCVNLESLPFLVLGGALNMNGCTRLRTLPSGLQLHHHVYLINCSSLEALPNDFQLVGGSFYIMGCRMLGGLPENLHVRGSLCISGQNGFDFLPEGLKVGKALDLRCFTNLVKLPDNLEVGTHLDLTNCRNLIELPNHLTVNGHANFSFCSNLKNLGNNFTVGGYLDLTGCSELVTLPDNLQVHGYLGMRGCSSMTSLPAGLHVEGHADFSNCTNLHALPSDLCIGNFLDLSACAELEELPDDISVGSHIALARCTRLTQLPENLHVQGYLDMRGCTSFETIPNNLRVDGYLDLSDCSNLRTLPEDLHVGGSLSLRNCRNLISLPSGLQIPGSLDLSGCTSLQSLPPDLQVGGELKLAHCTALTDLPETISFRGALDIRYCLNLQTISPRLLQWVTRQPDGVYQIRHEGSGLRPEIIARITNNARSINIDNLIVVAHLWQDLATERDMVDFHEIQYDITTDQINNLLQFLNRLRETMDYRNTHVRPYLARRVLNFLLALERKQHIRSRLLQIIEDANNTCADRVILALNNLEIAMRIEQAESCRDEAELKRIGKNFFKLEIINELAAQKIRSIRPMYRVDPIEVYLSYHTRLREVLDLPVSTDGMLFESCSGVTGQDIDTACLIAQDRADDMNLLDRYLNTWYPWQKFQRRKKVENSEYLRMPEKRVDNEILNQLVCSISLERYRDLEQPICVEISNVLKLYEYAAICAWWTDHGTDPESRLPIEFENWFRPIGHETHC